MATDENLDGDVPETGAVFTFGKSRFADNIPNKFWIRNDRVLQVACGDEHTALVAESGRIFTFGANDWGQLGLGHTKPTTKPSCIKSLKKEKVRMVTCGRSFTLVVTESGKVHTFGANGEGQCGLGVTDSSITSPQIVEALDNLDIKMLSAGTEHAVALTEDGDVYVWGGGSEGQLGFGASETEVPKPTKLGLEEKVVCISCGYYHTALVTDSGKLITFGEAEGGKLGLPEDADDTTVPQEVTGIKGKITWVSCGGSHTVAVTDDGKMYSFGDGSNGQLGHGTIQLNCTTPQQIIALKSHKIKWASCGENHTAAISVKGAMFTFGDGRHGKLGLGEENFANQFKPSKVNRFEKFIVEAVSCGGCHMLVLAKPRLENGDWPSSGEQSELEEETTNRLKPAILDSLRKSEDMDLTGSFSARDRRREKQDPAGTLNRTLPPLNSSFSGRALMSNGVAGHSFKKPPLADVVKIEDVSEYNAKPKQFNDGENKQEEEEEKENSSLGSVTQDSEESSETDRQKNREAIKSESTERILSLDHRPQPQPRTTKVKKKSKESDESEDESSKEESSESEKEDKAVKKPVPATRRRLSPAGKDAEASMEERESDQEGKKKLKKKSVKKKMKDSGDEDRSEDDKAEKPNKKMEGKAKPKKKKKPVAAGPFGKKKMLDSDDEEQSTGKEEESEEDEKDNKKKKGKKKEDKKPKKAEEEDSEEEENEKEDISKKKIVKIQNSDEDEGDAVDDGDEGKEEKEDEEETKPQEPKKKSKFCVIL